MGRWCFLVSGRKAHSECLLTTRSAHSMPRAPLALMAPPGPRVPEGHSHGPPLARRANTKAHWKGLPIMLLLHLPRQCPKEARTVQFKIHVPGSAFLGRHSQVRHPDHTRMK